MKNEAFLDGVQCAKNHLRESVVVTEKWWNTEMEGYASGHFSTPSARQHFCNGWKSVTPPSFVDALTVTLIVRLMNVSAAKSELSPLEKEMYHTFNTFNSLASISFVKESSICLTYQITSAIGALNLRPIVQFLKQQLVSYKVEEFANAK